MLEPDASSGAADDALVAAFSADLGSPGPHADALERLAARVVSGLAQLPSSAGTTRSVLTRSAAAYPLSDARDEPSAVALSQSLMIEGMSLSFDAAVESMTNDAAPRQATMDELAILLAAVDPMVAEGDLTGARRSFAATAVRALASPQAQSVLPFQLPEDCSLELRGWAGGLGLLLGARRELLGA